MRAAFFLLHPLDRGNVSPGSPGWGVSHFSFVTKRKVCKRKVPACCFGLRLPCASRQTRGLRNSPAFGRLKQSSPLSASVCDARRNRGAGLVPNGFSETYLPQKRQQVQVYIYSQQPDLQNIRPKGGYQSGWCLRRVPRSGRAEFTPRARRRRRGSRGARRGRPPLFRHPAGSGRQTSCLLSVSHPSPPRITPPGRTPRAPRPGQGNK